MRWTESQKFQVDKLHIVSHLILSKTIFRDLGIMDGYLVSEFWYCVISIVTSTTEQGHLSFYTLVTGAFLRNTGFFSGIFSDPWWASLRTHELLTLRNPSICSECWPSCLPRLYSWITFMVLTSDSPQCTAYHTHFKGRKKSIPLHF